MSRTIVDRRGLIAHEYIYRRLANQFSNMAVRRANLKRIPELIRTRAFNPVRSDNAAKRARVEDPRRDAIDLECTCARRKLRSTSVR